MNVRRYFLRPFLAIPRLCNARSSHAISPGVTRGLTALSRRVYQWRMHLSDYLRDRGETTTHFAGRVNTSRVSISRIIHRRQMPSAELMKRIHAATDGAVTANDFVHAEAAA